MHLSGSAAFFHAVPIVNAISRVAVLLYLDDEIASADCMQPSARKKDCVARFDKDSMSLAIRLSLFQGFDESAARGAFFQSGKNFGLGCGVGDIPELRFRFAAKFLRDCGGWMHLQ